MGERLPIQFGMTIRVCEYLHDVTASDGGIDRFQTTVDSGILGVVAEFGMYLVGEVNNSSVLRKDYFLPLWRENLNVIIIKGRNDVFHVSFITLRPGDSVVEYGTEFLDPHLDICLVSLSHATKLRLAYHGLAADMYFLPASEIWKQLHMDALVAILLRSVDVVAHAAMLLLETVGKDTVDFHSHLLLVEGCLFLVKHHFYKVTVFQMVEIIAVFFHLAPKAERAAIVNVHASLDTGSRQCFRYLAAESFQIIFVCLDMTFNERRNLLVLVGTAESEREVLQFCLNVVETETVGERSIEIVGLPGDLHLLFGLHRCQSAHVVESVGKFHKDGTDVVLHRVKQLTVIVKLLRQFIIMGGFLGDDLYKKSHVIAETLANILDCVRSVLHNIMQETGDYRIGTKHQLFSRYIRHCYRMKYIRFAGLALLRGMSLTRQLESGVNTFHIFCRDTLSHDLENVVGTFLNYSVVIVLHD